MAWSIGVFATKIAFNFSFLPDFDVFIKFSVAHQEYRVVVHEESVIIGNDVQFKCNIQSYVTDFVSVSNWIDSEGLSFTVNQNFGNLFFIFHS